MATAMAGVSTACGLSPARPSLVQAKAMRTPATSTRLPSYSTFAGSEMRVNLSSHSIVSKSRIYSPSTSGRVKRGSLTTARSQAGEILTIVGIMNGITLVGVAVGFVLLRLESAFEESEEA